MMDMWRSAGSGLALALILLGCAPANAIGRNDIGRAAESYAMAACLTAQDAPFLRDQGDGWAANIVQRDAFDLDSFAALAALVKARVARGEMATITVENPPMTLKQLPIQTCGEIIDVPEIRAAIDAIERTSREADAPRR